ncbi:MULTISPECIES: DMT family transporter [unclassified Carboxydocella]|uniref:DMT family transporter n=1 Tax=unclassified Carboxydocella TaxID=2685367 RepID=UPI0009AE776F|nr:MULTISPECIES: DMT family transporter [unclassified Carboxydocella]GAW28706.1 Threonine/homoserine efflux transporter RhtA [Carboxydocella sp. ULO1]GAW30551.1 Threonine/homoserine efflux transporter RhtA [Carboxydocella sp. JDF658]
MDKKWQGLLATVISAMGFGSMAIFVKIAYQHGADPYSLLALRFLAACGVLWPLLVWKYPGQWRLGPVQTVRFALQGWLGYGITAIGYFSSLQYIPAGLTALILYLYPALIALLAWFFGLERPSFWQWSGIALSFLGCALVLNPFAGGFSATEWRGIGLALLAPGAYALFGILGQKNVEAKPPVVVTAWICLACALLFNALAPPWRWWSAMDQTGILAGLAIGILSTALAILGYLLGIEKLGASRAALISSFEPAFTVLLAALVLGENLQLKDWFGLLAILTGVILGQGKKEEAAQTAAST